MRSKSHQISYTFYWLVIIFVLYLLPLFCLIIQVTYSFMSLLLEWLLPFLSLLQESSTNENKWHEKKRVSSLKLPTLRQKWQLFFMGLPRFMPQQLLLKYTSICEETVIYSLEHLTLEKGWYTSWLNMPNITHIPPEKRECFAFIVLCTYCEL